MLPKKRILSGLRQWDQQAPWWLTLFLGLACVGFGAVIVSRPFTSLLMLRLLIVVLLAVSSAADLVWASRSQSRRWTAVAGSGWLSAALAVYLYPGLALGALAAVVGVALVVGGLVRVLVVLRGGGEDRVAQLLGALTVVVFGALALVWRDVTLLAIAVGFGARTLLFGCVQVVKAWRAARGGRTELSEPPSCRRRLRGRPRTAAMACSLVVALGLLAVSITLHRASPTPDAFYRPPPSVPAAPGALLRSEPFTQAVPKNARAWRILYTTTREDSVPAVASGIVLTARNPPAGLHPVIAWAHGTTGESSSCAPTLLQKPFAAGALPALDQIIANGWTLVATDYTGLGTAGPHPYLIGQGEARSVLDAVRAARHLAEVHVSHQTVVWGHSQGGHAALWTGQIQPAYAPDVPLAGVAALAPASDLIGLVANLNTVPGGSVFASYVVTAYSQTYPEVSFNRLIRPEAQAQVRGYAGRCLSEPEMLISIMSSLMSGERIFRGDPTRGTTGARLRQNTPTGYIQAPLLIAQGESDGLILPTVQRAFVQHACQTGDTIDYRTYPGRNHVGVVAPGSPLIPELLRWTQDRANGASPHNICK
ncbi:lipase family protein [Streptomyces violascens]|uniref:lipase family protein n=1 Tax=Streptomyces violascens TaxID=67381 RepID=UPI0036C84E65